MDEQEFERDEQLLEARRLKRLEQRRRRKVQQRIVLGVLLVILILSMVLIVRGCKSRSAQQEQSGETADAQQNAPESVVPTEPDTTVTIAAVGDIMMYDEQLDAARQDDGTYDFTSSFAAVSGSTVSADLTVGNLELRRSRWQRRSARLASMFCRRQTRTRFRTVFPGFRVPSGIWTRQGFRMWERMRRRTIRRASGACCSRTSTA